MKGGNCTRGADGTLKVSLTHTDMNYWSNFAGQTGCSWKRPQVFLMKELTPFSAKPLLFIAAFGLLGCRQSYPSSTSEVAECYVRYMKPEGQFLAEAVVRRRQDDSWRAVEVPGGMRYLGTLMRTLPMESGFTYRSEGHTSYKAEHFFNWTDEKGRTHRFNLSVLPVLNLSFGSKTLSRSKPAVLTWNGPPITEGETWVLLWEEVGRSITVPMEIIGTPGQERIEFPAVQMAEVPPGRWTYYIVRKKAFRQEEPGLLLKGLTEYYSDVDTVTVVD